MIGVVIVPKAGAQAKGAISLVDIVAASVLLLPFTCDPSCDWKCMWS